MGREAVNDNKRMIELYDENLKGVEHEWFDEEDEVWKDNWCGHVDYDEYYRTIKYRVKPLEDRHHEISNPSIWIGNCPEKGGMLSGSEIQPDEEFIFGFSKHGWIPFDSNMGIPVGDVRRYKLLLVKDAK
jgi:hypothetical protein